MNKTNNISKQAMIAAVYTVLSVVLSPVSYGPVQIRLSEALTLLPVFGLSNVWGITAGCFLTNLIGLMSGANILGVFDVVFGTLTTLAAGMITYCLKNLRIKNMPVLSAFPPIILNALVIGWELCVVVNGGFNIYVFSLQTASVAIGQSISCGIAGLTIIKIIEKNNTLKEYMLK